MKKTLQIIDRMHKEGLFKKYAIGGGIASLFYIEPIATFDLDIFVILPESEEVLLSLSPLYDWLIEKKYKLVKEHIIIEGIPVQEAEISSALLKTILNAHGLIKAYNNFRKKFHEK